MRQRRTLYRRVARDQPNNLPQSESKSVEPLWRNLRSSFWDRQRCNFMGIDGVEMSLIPACSWRQAEYSPIHRSGIGYVVVELSSG